MKNLILFVAFLLPILLCAQQDLKKLAKQSHTAFVYLINAAKAEKYIAQDSIDIDSYLNQIPTIIFNADSIDETKLPKGLYVIIQVIDDDVTATLTGVSNLVIYPVNNQKRVQLLVRDKEGNFINNAHIWVKDKEAVFDSKSQSYKVTQRNPEEAIVKIYTPSDTTYTVLSGEDDVHKTINAQRWANFKRTVFGRSILWLPNKIVSIFKSKRYHYKSFNIGATGTMVFNQPKYKVTDTVRLKAYVFDKKWRHYNKPAYLYLEYYKQGTQHKQFVEVLKPYAPGAFIATFPLSDTLENDITYTVELRNKKGLRIIAKTFRIEDYVLDEVATYNLRSIKDAYYPSDTMHFYCNAADANGLPLLDATAQLVLTTQSVNSFLEDSMYIPDTLFVQQKKLLTQGETVFDVPANILPNAGLKITAAVNFFNSNNELQNKDITIKYSPNNKQLVAEIKSGIVSASYMINGISAPKNAQVKIEGSFTQLTNIQLPATLKIDPLAEKYTFFVEHDNGAIDSTTADVENDISVRLNRISHGDTLGFTLANPYRVPVSFTVFNGNKVVGSGKSDAANIPWQTLNASTKKMYRVKWQYWWHNEEQHGEETVALLYKLLNINITGAHSVFPGQQDTVRVDVKDYKNQPVPDVNLTAVSYNSQFNKDIYVPDPPYLVKYKLRPTLTRDRFETDDAFIRKHYLLGKHTGWVKPFGLDSMLYYKMLLPASSYVDEATHIAGYSTQVSVHAVKQGQKQQIYMLYINRQLVYYSGVTDFAPYTFETFGGYTQIGIRLYDKFIEIDSMYIQPFYKHDIVLDINNLPPQAKTYPATNYLSSDEINLLEKSLWQLDNNNSTNNSYIWQGEKTMRIASANEHLLGPFNNWDSMHFFVPDNFDIHFRFEAGYQYNISPKILRLEKKKIFLENDKKYFLPKVGNVQWVLGDTILPHPTISYPLQQHSHFLRITDYPSYYSRSQSGKGSLQFTIAKDTSIEYVILYPVDTVKHKKILDGNARHINDIMPGIYTLLLVDKKLNTAQINNIEIKADTTFCLNTNNIVYQQNNFILTQLFYEVENPAKEKTIISQEPFKTQYNLSQTMPYYGNGKATITGKVIDKKGGLPIAFASVMIKNAKTGTSTDPDGNFILKNIKIGKCILTISSVGYETKDITVDASEENSKFLKIALNESTSYLNDVVVVGYGTVKKRDLTGSVSVVTGQELTSAANRTLAGKAAGVNITGEPGSTTSILIRGQASNLNNSAIFVIDGIVYDEMPDNITPDMISDVSVLKGAEATALYGMKAAEGVVIITTKIKTLRQQFRDYAFWQPQLFTDEKGHASFAVTYPDNTTGWQTYVLGMDKHRRMGKAASFVQSYKPVMAELSMPQFLTEGDSSQPVGKALNYTNDVYNATSTFTLNGNKTVQDAITLQPKASVVKQYNITAPITDTLKTSFTLQTSTGFKDGEERKIPVFKQGTEEATGNFWVLKNDTSVTFAPKINGSPIELYAENNTLNILLDEIEHLKTYPYYCMEQTSSKLRGLLIEKKIFEALHKPFTDDKTIDWLVQKMQKAQLFNGGWPWWENGNADINITNYVIKALLPLRSNPLVETSIRNGLLYLQNELVKLNSDELLSSLLTMCEAHHQLDYTPWLQKIYFDSLSIHQQWQYVKIKQVLNEEHATQLKILLQKATPSMLGSLHWGEDNYRWYGDANTTTMLAFEVLQQEKNYDDELNKIIQYFLEERKQGYWVNTVTSASVISATLPYLLAQNNSFQQPASVSISGDSTFSINQFPFKTTIKNVGTNNFTITKTGGGLVYFTAYQNFFNKQPQPVTNNFDVQTSFEKNGNAVASLTAGEKVNMVITVDALKEAEYVMIEIPIPAGCYYVDKKQDDWQVHKEFMKNKVVLFTEHLSRGMHTFTIDLENRFNGSYTLNPAKVSLMYFPTFFGRNEMRKIEIR